jgi:hypothetical protein
MSKSSAGVVGRRLSMEKLKDILWPIIAIGALGAFIDFLIGKAGQAKTKDLLLKWWVRFDDVRWKNFGREEGLLANNKNPITIRRRLHVYCRTIAS